MKYFLSILFIGGICFWYGLPGLYNFMLGSGIALFIFRVNRWMIDYYRSFVNHTRVGVALTFLIFLLKIPIIVIVMYFAVNIISYSLTCFFLGVGLVYCVMFYRTYKYLVMQG